MGMYRRRDGVGTEKGGNRPKNGRTRDGKGTGKG